MISLSSSALLQSLVRPDLNRIARPRTSKFRRKKANVGFRTVCGAAFSMDASGLHGARHPCWQPATKLFTKLNEGPAFSKAFCQGQERVDRV